MNPSQTAGTKESCKHFIHPATFCWVSCFSQAVDSSLKQEVDWSSSAWDLEPAWSNRKGSGSTAMDEGDFNSGGTQRAATAHLEGTKLASEYNWESVSSRDKPDPFSCLEDKLAAESQVQKSIGSLSFSVHSFPYQ